MKQTYLYYSNNFNELNLVAFNAQVFLEFLAPARSPVRHFVVSVCDDDEWFWMMLNDNEWWWMMMKDDEEWWLLGNWTKIHEFICLLEYAGATWPVGQV